MPNYEPRTTESGLLILPADRNEDTLELIKALVATQIFIPLLTDEGIGFPDDGR